MDPYSDTRPVSFNVQYNHKEITCKTQRKLELDKRLLAEMAAELDRTQRKFHLVDNLVDEMLLQEDSEFFMPDRPRQISDLIIDLEARMERMYKVILQEKKTNSTNWLMQKICPQYN